ncbi:hypothetical protein [Rhodanobacter lindaniclasticus]|nr:hypothetical protein [Rhodanobacter lindaniclasticus]
MMRWIVFVLFVGVALWVSPARASSNASYDLALSRCESQMSSYEAESHPSCAVGPVTTVLNPSCPAQEVCLLVDYGRGNYKALGWSFEGDPPPTCNANEVVPTGTPYLYSQASGATCRASDRCEMAFNVGGPNNGGYSLTGAVCSASGADFTGGDIPDPADPPPPGKPPPETSNPDGSTTFCDQISGTCVTAAPGAGGPPPSSGDTGDHAANGSTDSSSTTTNGATSSTTTTNTSSTTTSTTNTTTTGGGTSGGSGDSTSVGTTTGTTTGTQTSTTDTPASSSSTSSKCTTGVCDVGQADGIVGGMYQPSGETPATVYAQFRASVSASPLVSSVSGFFDTAGISGTCPTWHIPGNVYWGLDGFSFDFFCSAGMLQLLALAGMLVLAVGAFSAFRIAIY